MAEANFVQKTLDILLKIVEVEFKIPLGIAEIKFPVTAHAKEWWKNKISQTEVQQAIQRAEEKFVEDHKDDKVAQMLHEFPLYSEEEFKLVVVELLTHLSEEKISWLAEIKLQKLWGSIASTEELRNALELYIPYLRHELNGVEEFREIISALTLERIDKRTERMEDKLDQALKLEKKERKPAKLNTGWFFGHQYGDLDTFTGRDEERKMLTDWINGKKDNLLIIRALGGFGKTSLAWEWLNKDIDRQKWHTGIWWSFYEKESGFENFLAETLKHLGIETIDSSSRQQVNDLLEAMQQTNILIIMDGFERLLRQYAGMDAIYKGGDEDEKEMENIDPSQRDCVSLVVENFLKGLSSQKLQSKVLMTTRLTPRILENKNQKLLKRCREEPLDVFKPEDAIKYFQNEGIKKATRAEILDISTRYGFHPLSLSLLVGLINESHENKGDIIVAKQLDIFDDIRANRFHVLERAFESLTVGRKELLSKLSCFRGSVEYTTVKKLFSSPDLDKSLIDLRRRGLLKYTNETQRYDMHPIVRHYAYDHFTDEKRRKEAHVQLAMHFVDVMPVTNKNMKTLEDLAPVIELYHHMVRAGNLDQAMKLFYDRIDKPTFYQFGVYQLHIELLRALFLDGEDKPPHLKSEDAQGWTLSALGSAYAMSGQPKSSITLRETDIAILERMGDKNNLAGVLVNVAGQQLVIGALSAAERNLRRQIDLCREIADEIVEAVGHQELGRVLSYRGAWQEAEQQLETGLKLFEKHSEVQSQSVLLSYRALRFLLLARANPQLSIVNLKPALSNVEVASIECAQRALELADEDTKQRYTHPRDYVRAHWLLGAAYRASVVSIRLAKNARDYSTIELESLTLAEENLSKALNLCRQINAVDVEADILLDLARLRYAQNDFKDAQEKASEALTITERCGYVLQGADVNLFLAQYALEQEQDKTKAKEYAESALKLAYCDGPPYYYKVAYEEAERMLEKLK